MIDNLKIIFAFIGGLGLFIYGMHIMGEGLQKVAGSKMRNLLGILTSNKFLAIGLGAVVTAVVQSSSATTVMVVGFVNAGLMNLTQSVGVIMGANIGTTITSWIVSLSEWSTFLKPTTIAPIAVAIGVVLTMSAKDSRKKQVGEIIVGFGILFIGMSSMSSAVSPLKNLPQFEQLFAEFGANPILGILVGALVTVLVQSSSASVGILQAIALQGLVPWSAAFYIILGQNIGTCVTALISGLGASKNAKAAAYIHLLFNVIGSLVFGIIGVIYFKFFNPVLGSTIITITYISVMHTLYNISNTVVMFPFSKILVDVASKMAGVVVQNVSDKPGYKDKVHLDERLLESTPMALESSFNEVVRLGEVAYKALEMAGNAVIDLDKEAISSVEELEDRINSIEEGVTIFLTKLIKLPLSQNQNADLSNYFHTVSDLERVGDHCMNIAEEALYLMEEGVNFSVEAKKELIELIDSTKLCMSYALKANISKDEILARKSCEIEDIIDDMVNNLRVKHIERLSNGSCSAKAGIVFLDLISNLERISDHCKNVSEYVMLSSN